MSLTTESEKRASERFVLIRMNPARHISDELVLDSGSTYEMTFPFPISAIQRNGASLTRVTALSGNDQFTYDEETKLLQVRLASAPDSDTNVITCFYYIFYSSGGPGHAFETPTDSSGTLRHWKPYITDAPEIKQSVSNTLAGVFTIESSQIEIANSEHEFEQYLTNEDSFFDKSVEIWVCINATSNIAKIFSGKSRSVSLTRELVSITVLDSFSKMQSLAFFGDSADECYFRRKSGSFPNMDSRFQDSNVPLIIGKYSRFKNRANTFGTAVDSSTNPESLDTNFLPNGICTEYSAIVADSFNRTWGLCRTIESLKTNTIGSHVSINPLSGDLETIVITLTPTQYALSDITIGDSVKITETAKGDGYFTIVKIIPPAGFITNYTILGTGSEAATHTFTSAAAVTLFKACELIIKEIATGIEYFLVSGRDFTLNETTTTGGNKYISVTLTVAFETHHGFTAPMHPSTHEMFFKIKPNTTSSSHGSVMKRICSDADLETLNSTFTAADSGFDADILVSIPQFDEDDFKTYLDYAELITKSALSYAFINTQGQAEYHLVSSPTPSDVVTDDDFIIESVNCNVDYTDIVTQIIAYNPHDFSSAESIGDASATATDNRSRYLHGADVTTRLRHCLDTISARIDAHMRLKSRPSVIYQLKTATRDIETDIGDEITLSDQQAIGGNSTVDLKVTGIEKSNDLVTVQLAVIEGL